MKLVNILIELTGNSMSLFLNFKFLKNVQNKPKHFAYEFSIKFFLIDVVVTKHIQIIKITVQICNGNAPLVS